MPETELGRSKISSRYQVVLPEGVRKHLNLTSFNQESEYYAYFYKANGEVHLRIAVVRKKEEITFLDGEETS